MLVSSQAAIVKADREEVCCTQPHGDSHTYRLMGRLAEAPMTPGSGDKDRPRRGRVKERKETGGEAGREEEISERGQERKRHRPRAEKQREKHWERPGDTKTPRRHRDPGQGRKVMVNVATGGQDLISSSVPSFRRVARRLGGLRLQMGAMGWGLWAPPLFPTSFPPALLSSRLTLALTIPPQNTKLLWPPPWNGSLPSSYSALFGLLVIALITACLGLKVTRVCAFLSFPVSWEPLENRVA